MANRIVASVQASSFPLSKTNCWKGDVTKAQLRLDLETVKLSGFVTTLTFILLLYSSTFDF